MSVCLSTLWSLELLVLRTHFYFSMVVGIVMIMVVNCRSLKLASWNVRGLGRNEKCRDVKRALNSCNADFIAL